MNKILTNTTLQRVRYADTDKMGVVYNGNYLTFFEIGRTELMRHFGLPYTEVENAGYLLPLVDAYCKYLSPAKYDDILEINAKLDYQGGIRIKFEYEIFVAEKKIAEGFTTHIFVDALNMKPQKPPQFFANILESLQ